MYNCRTVLMKMLSSTILSYALSGFGLQVKGFNEIDPKHANVATQNIKYADLTNEKCTVSKRYTVLCKKLNTTNNYILDLL